MKIKKVLKYSIIVILSLVVIIALGLFLWSATSTYPARAVALSALESTETVTVTSGKQIVFTPDARTDTGLIFYPGGLVEPAAYAPVLHKLAEEGLLVIITPMPLNLAIFNTGTANTVIETYPQISTWILAGHSLGGASAGIFAGNNPAAIEALAFWDSYPPDSADLSDYSIPVISIYGTSNGNPNTDNFNEKRHLLPSNTVFVPIEGASHAQFGDYGPQKGDVTPALNLAEQHEQVVELMLDFIHKLQ